MTECQLKNLIEKIIFLSGVCCDFRSGSCTESELPESETKSELSESEPEQSGTKSVYR